MVWWSSRAQVKKRSIFRWPGKSKSTPESLLKVSLPECVHEEPRFTPLFTISPQPLQWLLRSSAHIPDSVTIIDLLSINDRISSQGDVDDFQGEDGTPLGVRSNGSPGVQEDGIPSLEDRLRILLAAPMEIFLRSEDGVLEWPAPLMPFQHDGVRALMNSNHLLLADDMGLGKTLQTIAALRILLVQGLIGKVLIITPVSVLDQWRSEFAKWAPEVRPLIVRGSIEERRWLWKSTAHVDVALVGYQILCQIITVVSSHW